MEEEKQEIISGPKKNFFHERFPSGWQRIFLFFISAVIAGVLIFLGYKLILIGSNGSWKIVAEFKGLSLYLTSICPGLFFIFGAIFELCWVSSVLKNIK